MPTEQYLLPCLVAFFTISIDIFKSLIFNITSLPYLLAKGLNNEIFVRSYSTHQLVIFDEHAHQILLIAIAVFI